MLTIEEIRNLCEKLYDSAADEATKVINTARDCSWQQFQPLSDRDVDELESKDKAIATACVYNNGMLQLSITWRPISEADEKSIKGYYERMKAQNIALLAVQKMQEWKQMAIEADELLAEAAERLGKTKDEILHSVKR